MYFLRIINYGNYTQYDETEHGAFRRGAADG